MLCAEWEGCRGFVKVGLFAWYLNEAVEYAQERKGGVEDRSVTIIGEEEAPLEEKAPLKEKARHEEKDRRDTAKATCDVFVSDYFSPNKAVNEKNHDTRSVLPSDSTSKISPRARKA